ncbi:tetratricopeptide repeat protein [Streptomyces sp. NBC_01591]|uniref:tetratricopeptide repeat protein n=1 Tax=Streptomyces sp. NBC_01591 TaxID=2975888 RepID=UPI002DD8B562|nr:tetratricopeptide repeat protein [Streptomyces sp. NBC_01591]WSD73545.1 tetratricopeptide repeat protein [Streptomyces sp. NBC_01591]
MAERALSLHESCLLADGPAIATDLDTLARIRHLLGDHEAAVPLAERALRIDEAAYGPDDPYGFACHRLLVRKVSPGPATLSMLRIAFTGPHADGGEVSPVGPWVASPGTWW